MNWKQLASTGLGMVAGGGIPGLLLGFGASKLLDRFGRGKQAAPTDPRAAMLAQLTGDVNAPLDRSTLYQTGLAGLQRQATDAAAMDAGSFARRGMAGGEAELAARSARGEAIGAGQVGLLQGAAQDRQGRLQMLAGLAGQLEAEKEARKQRNASMWGTVGTLAGQAATAYLTRGQAKN